MSDHIGIDTADDSDLPPAVSLAALDPQRDGASFDRVVRSIGSAAASTYRLDRARTSSITSVLAAVAEGSRVTVAAALALSLVSAVCLASLSLPPRKADMRPATFAEAIGIPASLVRWSAMPDSALAPAAVMDAAGVSAARGGGGSP